MMAGGYPFDGADLPHHGGDVAAAARAFGLPRTGWLDLSTAVNPHAYPVASISYEGNLRLPDSDDDRSLREAAAGYYRAPDACSVVPAPGSQALIRWLPRLRARSRVAVVGTTFAEHARSWRIAGHEVALVPELDEAAVGFDVVVLCNPNTPDGRRTAPDRLVGEARRLAADGGWLVVDEAFADLAPDVSVAAAACPGLVVLRSFGKFFGLPGLRLGFAVADADLARTLSDALGPWAVSGWAGAIACAAFADEAWIEGMRATLARDAQRMDALLADHALEVVAGTALFHVVETPNAKRIFESLASARILVRWFPDMPGSLRFGLPGPRRDWERLRRALEGAAG
jgi:cobalamin biosynthetic protein CobC